MGWRYDNGHDPPDRRKRRLKIVDDDGKALSVRP